MILNKLKAVLMITRPRFLVYLFGPYLVGYLAGVDSYSKFFSFDFIYIFIFFMLPANFILYGLNDLFDQATDRINKKKGQYENLFSSNQLKLYTVGIVVSSILAVPILFTLNTVALLIFLAFLFLAVFYSAPPLRFKARPFLDFFSNVLYIFPGLLAFAQSTSGRLPDTNIIASSWLWASAMHLFSAIPDIEADKTAGIQTSAVFLGRKKSLVLCFLMWSASSFLMISYSSFFIISLFYPAIVLGVVFNKLSLEKTYWRFSFINLLLGFLLFWYVALT
jgi:4-hydroxybenzoate polyprenyltransferase